LKSKLKKESFGHRLQGSAFMKKMILKTLRFLPEDIVNFITQKVWFVGSFEDGWAFTLRGNELKPSEYLIFLSDELLREDEKQIVWTIAHEIGHIVLRHRNSIGEVQSRLEVRKQEREADQFARKYIL